jgi:hypothetical protein
LNHANVLLLVFVGGGIVDADLQNARHQAHLQFSLGEKAVRPLQHVHDL